jgi:hypothetical protein
MKAKLEFKKNMTTNNPIKQLSQKSNKTDISKGHITESDKQNNNWRERLRSLFIGMKLSKKNKLEIDELFEKEIQTAREEERNKVLKKVIRLISKKLKELNCEPISEGKPEAYNTGYFNGFSISLLEIRKTIRQFIKG